MLYLIKQESKNNTYYKIGFAKNVSERMKTYDTHNAEFELIDSFEGEIQHENILHEHLKDYKVPNKNEWFYYDNKVLQIWNMYKSLYSEFGTKFQNKINNIVKQYNKLKEQINTKERLIEMQQSVIDKQSQIIDYYKNKLEKFELQTENKKSGSN